MAPVGGTLHTAKRFYLASILGTPTMSKVTDGLAKLPPDKRLAYTCNLEALGQVGNAGRGFKPDAIVPDAFGKASLAGTRTIVTGGIFRSGQKWYRVAYDCTLNRDLSAVTSFTYRIGDDVTAIVKAKSAN
jgi:hypothetical protein